MAKKKDKKEKPYMGRDYAMIEILTGAVKAGVHVDRKKEANKKKCRKPVKDDE